MPAVRPNSANVRFDPAAERYWAASAMRGRSLPRAATTADSMRRSRTTSSMRPNRALQRRPSLRSVCGITIRDRTDETSQNPAFRSGCVFGCITYARQYFLLTKISVSHAVHFFGSSPHAATAALSFSSSNPPNHVRRARYIIAEEDIEGSDPKAIRAQSDDNAIQHILYCRRGRRWRRLSPRTRKR